MTFQELLKKYLLERLPEGKRTKDDAILALRPIFTRVAPTLISGQERPPKSNLSDEQFELATLMLSYLREHDAKGPNVREMLQTLEPLILSILRD